MKTIVSTALVTVLLTQCTLPDKFDADAYVNSSVNGELSGTWVMTADYDFENQVDTQPGTATEQARSLVFLTPHSDNTVDINNCYPGMATQTVTLRDNDFFYDFFTLITKFKMPTPGRAKSNLEGMSGEVSLQGKAAFTKISNEKMNGGNISIELSDGSSISTPIDCFAEIEQRSSFVEDSQPIEQELRKIVATSFNGDTVVKIELEILVQNINGNSTETLHTSSLALSDMEHFIQWKKNNVSTIIYPKMGSLNQVVYFSISEENSEGNEQSALVSIDILPTY